MSTLSFGLTSSIDASLRRFDAALVLNIANGFWLPAFRAARVPCAVNTDGIEWRRAKWNAVGKAAFYAGAKLTARLAPELVCDSRAIGDIWETEFGRTSTFIPYGGDILGDLGDWRVRELGLEPRQYALVVARLAPENNVELTLDAIERLGENAPRTVIVGSEQFNAPISLRLRALHDAGKILWLGHVHDQELLMQLWQQSGVYVHGHSVGGTNPALLQALGAGAPTLALDTPFNREVLQSDDHLFSRDAVELAQHIASVTGSPSAQAALIRSGQAAVSERYTWRNVCEQYTSLLVRLAQDGADARTVGVRRASSGHS